MTITSSLVADYVAGRLSPSDARVVEEAVAQFDDIALEVWTARDHAMRARRRLGSAFQQRQ